MSITLRWLIAATLTITGAIGVGRFAYTPLLPDMVSTFGWTFADAGDVASANFFGYMLGALIAPRCASSPSARNWFAFSIMLSVASTYLGAHVQSFGVWLLLRGVAGAASALCLVMVTTQLMLTLQVTGRSHLGNVHFAGVGMGIVLCMAVLRFPGGVDEQWSNLGGAAALVMVLAWIVLGGLSFRTQPATTSRGGLGLGTTLWRLIAGYGLFGCGYVISATFIVAMERRLVGVEAQGLVWWTVGLALIPSVFLWQAVANRFGMRRILRLAYLVECAGVLMSALADSLALLVASCVLLGSTFAAITALGIHAARDEASDRVGFVVSAMTLAFALGQWLGPLIGGRMADASGSFAAPSLLAASALLVAALLVPGTRRGHL